MNSMRILHVVKLKRPLHNIRKILVVLVGLARLPRTWMMDDLGPASDKCRPPRIGEAEH
ncbi:hypothetical protein BofuT4_uP006040.1 [Botrytis cinerea T4]|uniref:Uncharacterized protein n=1 Tax=Botryotinia fuckeliana (strain T4) TaxID=999810 RepID=G2Y455_BOTF4|nr:hypothetical protein BofuT4_uP006040.1 [Botrytis cinerea T4]